MKAPDWFSTKGGLGCEHPPPPPIPGPSGQEKKNPPPAPKRAPPKNALAQPFLPQLPAVPGSQLALPQPGQQLALPLQPGVLPPPGAPPALANLPYPPPPPGAPGSQMTQMQTGGATGGDTLAIAMEQGIKSAVANGSLALSRVKARPPVQDEKPFEIWGLQHRAYTEAELMEAFEMLDLDRHGFVGAQDIRRVLDLCGEGDVTEPEVCEMLRLVDSDARGKVDYEEFADQYIDPPAVFRNFDMHKRESGMDEIAALRSAGSSSKTSEAFMTDLRGQAVKDIMGRRKLTPDFIKTVYGRFVELDVDERGFCCFEDFCFILRRAENEEMRRAFDVFDTERIGELDLRQFIVALSMYTNATSEEKLRFAFMMFDEEQKEEVEHTDVAELFKAIAPHLPEEIRVSHEKRMYQLLNLNPSMGVVLDEFLDYALEYADELVPASPSPSSVSSSSGSRSSGSSSGTGTRSSYSGSRPSDRGSRRGSKNSRSSGSKN